MNKITVHPNKRAETSYGCHQYIILLKKKTSLQELTSFLQTQFKSLHG